MSVSFCVKECPSSTGQTICLYDTKGIDYPNDDPYYAKFCYVQLRSDPLGKYCIPKEPINRSKVDVFLNQQSYMIKRFASDLSLATDIVIMGVLISVGIAYMF